MNSVIITDYGVALGKTGDRLVVRGPRPRLELIEGGPQLFLPLGIPHQRPTLTVVTSNGHRTPPPPLRRERSTGRDAGATGTEARAAGTHSTGSGQAAAAITGTEARATVKPPKKSPEQIEMPLFRVSEIIIGSPGVSVFADLIEACCERGIRISFLTRRGDPFAMLSSPMLTATVETRRLHSGSDRGLLGKR